MNAKTRILLIDDDRDMADSLCEQLRIKGFEARSSGDAASALQILDCEPADLVLLDLFLGAAPGPDTAGPAHASGLDFLNRLRQAHDEIPIIVLTGAKDARTAVAAMKAGAGDYLVKPVSGDELVVVIEKAIREKNLRREVERLKQKLRILEGETHFLGTSPATQRLMEETLKVAATDMTVIIEGESGSGKELIARSIHQESPRSEGPFLALDCGAIPADLMESELFGHEPGAFTGAVRRSLGLLEAASGGTLLFDEIANLSPVMQAKLLRVLETRLLRRLGGKKDISFDVRVLAASNQNLQRLASDGKFRQDLFYRLNQYRLSVPPLRERPQDIPVLARHFLERAKQELGKSSCAIDDAAIRSLLRHNWPGNARELKNTIARACLLADDMIRPEHLGLNPEFSSAPSPYPRSSRSAAPGAASSASGLPQGDGDRRWGEDGKSGIKKLADQEREMVLAALRKTNNNKRQAAALLGIHRTTLYYKLKKLSLNK